MTDSKSSKKRARTIFTMDQLQKMESVFQKQQYIVGSDRLELAQQLNLSEMQVSCVYKILKKQ